MMKYLQRLKAKKGLTLVEVMIATVIFSLITLAAASFYRPVNQVAKMIQSDTDVLRVAEAADSFITRQLRNAVEIEFHTSTTTANFNSMAVDAINEFKLKPDGTLAKPTKDGTLPMALVIKKITAAGKTRTFLYNIRLNEFNGSSSVTVANLNNIENWKAFNRSFYEDIELRIEMAITNPDPTKQRRGHTYLKTQVEAYRDGDMEFITEDDISTSNSQTQLAWIGGAGGNEGSAESPKFEARVYVDNVMDETANIIDAEEILILYHHDVQLERDPDETYATLYMDVCLAHNEAQPCGQCDSLGAQTCQKCLKNPCECCKICWMGPLVEAFSGGPKCVCSCIHTFDDTMWVEYAAASCTKEGTETNNCLNCGKEGLQKISTLPHDPDLVNNCELCLNGAHPTNGGRVCTNASPCVAHPAPIIDLDTPPTLKDASPGMTVNLGTVYDYNGRKRLPIDVSGAVQNGYIDIELPSGATSVSNEGMGGWGLSFSGGVARVAIPDWASANQSLYIVFS